jgi:hypothetical protein
MSIKEWWSWRAQFWGIFFWPKFWVLRTLCAVGWHRFMLLYITNGRTDVHCWTCNSNREPTAKERASHPNQRDTREQKRLNDWINEKFPRKETQ